jgi:hypothetical protein
MPKQRPLDILAWCSAVVLLSACGGGAGVTTGGSSGGGGPAPTPNSSPVAVVEVSDRVAVGATVTLDGSASYDPDQDALQFLWSFNQVPLGSNASISGVKESKASFKADKAGVYALTLNISDGRGGSSTTSPRTVRANTTPQAQAVALSAATLGAVLELDGSVSTDADGDALSYAWSLVSAPQGSQAAVQSATAVKARFTPDVAGRYTFALKVNDGRIDSAPFTFSVQVDSPL